MIKQQTTLVKYKKNQHIHISEIRNNQLKINKHVIKVNKIILWKKYYLQSNFQGNYNNIFTFLKKVFKFASRNFNCTKSKFTLLHIATSYLFHHLSAHIENL